MSSRAETAEVCSDTTTDAAAVDVVCAVAAAATLKPTSMLARAPQNAAKPPIIAAAVATVDDRSIANTAIAVNETPRAARPKMTNRFDRYSRLECAAAIDT